MAQRIETILIDDLDGKSASETITFGLDGVSYEIDLSDKNAKKLRGSLAPWAEAGRRAGGRRAAGKTRAGKRRASSERNVEVREWARTTGHTIGTHGRIPKAVYEAYDAVH